MKKKLFCKHPADYPGNHFQAQSQPSQATGAKHGDGNPTRQQTLPNMCGSWCRITSAREAALFPAKDIERPRRKPPLKRAGACEIVDYENPILEGECDKAVESERSFFLSGKVSPDDQQLFQTDTRVSNKFPFKWLGRNALTQSEARLKEWVQQTIKRGDTENESTRVTGVDVKINIKQPISIKNQPVEESFQQKPHLECGNDCRQSSELWIRDNTFKDSLISSRSVVSSPEIREADTSVGINLRAKNHLVSRLPDIPTTKTKSLFKQTSANLQIQAKEPNQQYGVIPIPQNTNSNNAPGDGQDAPSTSCKMSVSRFSQLNGYKILTS